MTEKELANDLFDRVIEVEDRKWDIDDGCGITVDQAKQIAIFIVDNLIKNTLECYEDCFNHDNWHGEYDTKRSSTIIEYYNEVKKEIEKIC